MSDRPNILLLMTDQQRGDCLGIEGHPVLQTPYLDHLAAEGVRFRHAYSACPVCVPARRTLMTGQTPFHHGVMMNYDTALSGPTLPGELAQSGYQTHLVGKLHLWPHRKLYGFCSADWSDGPGHGGDYDTWLEAHGIRHPYAGLSHGATRIVRSRIVIGDTLAAVIERLRTNRSGNRSGRTCIRTTPTAR